MNVGRSEVDRDGDLSDESSGHILLCRHQGGSPGGSGRWRCWTARMNQRWSVLVVGCCGRLGAGRQDAADFGRFQSTMIALLGNAQEGWPRW